MDLQRLFPEVPDQLRTRNRREFVSYCKSQFNTKAIRLRDDQRLLLQTDGYTAKDGWRLSSRAACDLWAAAGLPYMAKHMNSLLKQPGELALRMAIASHNIVVPQIDWQLRCRPWLELNQGDNLITRVAFEEADLLSHLADSIFRYDEQLTSYGFAFQEAVICDGRGLRIFYARKKPQPIASGFQEAVCLYSAKDRFASPRICYALQRLSDKQHVVCDAATLRHTEYSHRRQLRADFSKWWSWKKHLRQAAVAMLEEAAATSFYEGVTIWKPVEESRQFFRELTNYWTNNARATYGAVKLVLQKLIPAAQSAKNFAVSAWSRLDFLNAVLDVLRETTDVAASLQLSQVGTTILNKRKRSS